MVLGHDSLGIICAAHPLGTLPHTAHTHECHVIARRHHVAAAIEAITANDGESRRVPEAQAAHRAHSCHACPAAAAVIADGYPTVDGVASAGGVTAMGLSLSILHICSRICATEDRHPVMAARRSTQEADGQQPIQLLQHTTWGDSGEGERER